MYLTKLFNFDIANNCIELFYFNKIMYLIDHIFYLLFTPNNKNIPSVYIRLC